VISDHKIILKCHLYGIREDKLDELEICFDGNEMKDILNFIEQNDGEQIAIGLSHYYRSYSIYSSSDIDVSKLFGFDLLCYLYLKKIYKDRLKISSYQISYTDNSNSNDDSYSDAKYEGPIPHDLNFY
jgi:hypothetical protein